MARKDFLFWLASWLTIGMSAPASAQPPVDVSKACAEWRWIGISKSEGHCPKIPGWEASLLFPSLRPTEPRDELHCSEEERTAGVCVPDRKLIGDLRRFCVYEVPRGVGSLPSPPASAGLVRIDQDCAAISLSATAVSASRTRKFFVEQAGGRALAVQNPDAVRLSFLDTEPTTDDPSDRRGQSPHGYTLLRIAQDMLCNEGRCAARIASRLALPLVSFNPKHPEATQVDEKHGGFMGLQGYLAQAIQAEVDAWRRDPKGWSRHLVLNLSLAWDGSLFGGLDERTVAETRAGTQAVYKALQYAAGFDVLVLAAAGNQKGKPCASTGPLLPAAWEKGTLQEQSRGRLRAPLVYAVGGVRSNGHPLVNARERGMPRRAAYGENALVPSKNPGDPTTVITGSSVSTAVVSSIAAAVWSSFPELSSRQVMATLDASGDTLEREADFWFGSDAALPLTFSSRHPRVHRLSLCNALQAAWNRWGTSSAKAQLGCATWQPVSSLGVPSDWVPDSCQPWVHSQPEKPPCLSCGDSGTPPPPQ
jgi:hypothetical protein